jgi:alkylation response protein AidB-like acyl-CoA dehydrogenase
MTFALNPEQEEARARAQAFARDHLAAHAAVIDEEGVIAGELLRELQATVGAASADSTALVVAVEELATVSAAAAAASALGQNSQSAPVAEASGLRGMPEPSVDDARGRLIFAAVALGVARAAVKAALNVLRDAAPGASDQEKPHWVMADAATEVEAARMLTLQAAQAFGEPSAAEGRVAMAKLAATRAAAAAVDAAVRIVGTDALSRGALLERLSRDVRALSLMMGSEEDLRATAAQSLLPG